MAPKEALRKEPCLLGEVLHVQLAVRHMVRRSRDRRRAVGLEGHIHAAVGRKVPGHAEAGHMEVVGRERGIRRGVAEREHRSVRPAAGEGGRSLVEAGTGLAEEHPEEDPGAHRMAVEGREAVGSLEEDQAVHREEVVRMRRKAALWSSQQSPRSSR
jgi:hypothetical protein